MIAEAQKQMIMSVAIAVIMAVLLILGNNWYQTGVRARALAESRGNVITSTDATVQRTPVVQQEQQRVDVVVSNARATWKSNTQEDQRREPSLRNRADQPVPDSVRQRARERRLARERSNGAADAGND